MNPQVHFGCIMSDFCIGVSGSVIKELGNTELDVFPRTGGDSGGYGVDWLFHGAIYGLAVVIKEAAEGLAVM